MVMTSRMFYLYAGLYLLFHIPRSHQIVPEPVAFFPLNGTYGTREIQDRVPPGNASGVQLAPGPDGQVNGSYEFFGNASSYIEFNNSDGGVLNVRGSMTMLCWVYYDGQDGPLFYYRKRVGQSGMFLAIVNMGKLLVGFQDRSYNPVANMTSPSDLVGGWKFVGVSYHEYTGKVNLWIDGVAVQTIVVSAMAYLGTQYKVRMGAEFTMNRNFKGRITQMRLYSADLSQGQVQEIMAMVSDVDDCVDQPCQNYGICIDGVNNYTCNCMAGYTGRNCSNDIDDCVDKPCQNNGTCIDGVNNYTCNCVAGYTGRNCSDGKTGETSSQEGDKDKVANTIITLLAIGIALIALTVIILIVTLVLVYGRRR